MGVVELHPDALRDPREPGPRYDLTPREVNELGKDFLNQREVKPESQFGCYVIDGNDPYSNLGRYVESSVFLEAFGNTPDLMANEYGDYEGASEFFVVMNHESEAPIGVIRVIKDSPAGLKSLKDLAETPLELDEKKVMEELTIDPERCVDVGTLAIQPEFRAKIGNILPSLLLYRTLFLRYLGNPDYDHVVTIIDKSAEKNLYRLSFPFRPIDERYFPYLDSHESRALYGVNKEFYPSVTRRRDELKDQASQEDSSSKLWYAAALDGLADGTHLDEMLGFEK